VSFHEVTSVKPTTKLYSTSSWCGRQGSVFSNRSVRPAYWPIPRPRRDNVRLFEIFYRLVCFRFDMLLSKGIISKPLLQSKPLIQIPSSRWEEVSVSPSQLLHNFIELLRNLFENARVEGCKEELEGAGVGKNLAARPSVSKRKMSQVLGPSLRAGVVD
jgi:hypothetical protein